MRNQENSNIPNFDHLNDRVIAEGINHPTLSIKTNLDSKSSLENNPYYDKSKEYSKEELEKFKKFFGG